MLAIYIGTLLISIAFGNYLLSIVVIPFINEKGENFFLDYKSELQEMVQTDKKSVVYELINEEGPAHDRTFTINVIVEGIVLGTGTAKSKKEAEQIAAKCALEKQAKIS